MEQVVGLVAQGLLEILLVQGLHVGVLVGEADVGDRGDDFGEEGTGRGIFLLLEF